jgi:hypothetical protein
MTLKSRRVEAKKNCRLSPPEDKQWWASAKPPDMGFHLLPSQGSRRIRLVSGNPTAQLRLHFLVWLRSPTLLHNLIPQTKDQLQPILERPAADSVQGGLGFHKENSNRGDAVSLPRMVRPDKSPDADDAAGQAADAEATEDKQSGRGCPRPLFFASFADRRAGVASAYQELPRGARVVGVQAVCQALAITPPFTALMLPSPKPTSMTPMWPD